MRRLHPPVYVHDNGCFYVKVDELVQSQVFRDQIPLPWPIVWQDVPFGQVTPRPRGPRCTT